MKIKLSWRKAGQPDHHDDKVDSNQLVVNEEFSLSTINHPDLLVAGVEGESVVARVDHLVQDLGFGCPGLGFRVQGSGFRAQD